MYCHATSEKRSGYHIGLCSRVVLDEMDKHSQDVAAEHETKWPLVEILRTRNWPIGSKAIRRQHRWSWSAKFGSTWTVRWLSAECI